MQVKLCPKCGSENKEDKASCSGCYASLEGIAPTEAKDRPAPVQAPPAAQQPPAAQPLSSSGPGAASDGPPAPNYGPPPSTYGPSFNERRSAPVKRGPNWGAIVLGVLLLGGAAFAGWWFFLKPAGPEAAVQRMMDAINEGDWDKMKSCYTQSSVSMLEMIGDEKMREVFAKSKGKDPGAKIIKTTYENDGKTAVVEVESANGQGTMLAMKSQELVLLQESGRWKIDIRSTGMRMQKKMYPNGVPAMPRPR